MSAAPISSFFSSSGGKKPSASSAPMDVESQEEKGKIHSRETPWVEKYRPRKMDDVAFQHDTIATLKKAIKTGNMPHLLFFGPPGTGKTSTILALCRELYGPDLMKQRVLELNASDDRGIAMVRSKIKSFAQLSVKSGGVKGYPCPPYKFVILDEADSMTADAQSALRRTMEAHSRITRVCMICNYVSRIIEPLASRCAKFRFKPLEKGTVLDKLKEIAAAENIEFREDVFARVISVSGGDMRKAVTYLQSAWRLYGQECTGDNVAEVAGVVPERATQHLLDVCEQNDGERVEGAVGDIVADGFPALDLVESLFRFVSDSNSIVDLQKAQIVERIGTVERNLVDGADEFLQLLDLALFIMFIYNRDPAVS